MRVETSENLARGGRIAAVAGLHAAVLYAIATSLGIVRPPEIVAPLQASLIEATQPAHPYKAVPVRPQIVQAQLDVPLPDTPPQVDVPEQTSTPPADSPPTEAISDANLQVTRRVEPGYPPASRRAGEQGTVVLSVLVDAAGHPQQIKVRTSSGHERLDQAAMEAIRRWTFNPAVRGSQKVTAWTSVRVKFELQNAAA